MRRRHSWTFRRGWIFVTNTLETRKALSPLQSMWLDLLIARVISLAAQPNLPNFWMVLDELAALQNLPQLKVAITENRKAGFSTIVGSMARASWRESTAKMPTRFSPCRRPRFCCERQSLTELIGPAGSSARWRSSGCGRPALPMSS